MDEAKIRLSQKEMELITNADWILTKNHVLKKTWQLLEELQQRQQKMMRSYEQQLPAEITNTIPKISRGENYKGLPYLILDHPRIFEKGNTFAIRSMFWWG